MKNMHPSEAASGEIKNSESLWRNQSRMDHFKKVLLIESTEDWNSVRTNNTYSASFSKRSCGEWLHRTLTSVHLVPGSPAIANQSWLYFGQKCLVAAVSDIRSPQLEEKLYNIFAREH